MFAQAFRPSKRVFSQLLLHSILEPRAACFVPFLVNAVAVPWTCENEPHDNFTYVDDHQGVVAEIRGTPERKFGTEHVLPLPHVSGVPQQRPLTLNWCYL